MKVGKDEIRRQIPVISNDEIGDLVMAFNKLQQFEMKYDDIKNDFFSNVSHELGTPLNIILASTQLLCRLREITDLESINNINNINKYQK